MGRDQEAGIGSVGQGLGGAPGFWGDKMQKLTLIIWVCMIAMVGSVSAQTVAFQNNFDHDTPGSVPITDPPGEPDGDAMELVANGGAITVQETVGPIVGQPVLMDRQSAGEFRLRAWLDADLWYCDSYSIHWRSAARNNVFFVSCSARSDNLKLLTFLEYRQGLVLDFRGAALEIPGGYQIDVMQEFEMTLDMTTETTSLSVDGVPLPGMQDIAQYQIGGDGLQSFTITFGGTAATQFVVDDIEIIANCDGTPTEPVNWGAVKSLYR
jgi:hypothetical protein